MKQYDHIDWTDVLFIPGALIFSYILAQWLSPAQAVALAVIVFSLVFSLFERRKVSFRRLIVAALSAGLVSYLLVALLNWPP